jgi:hypothetical protein
MKETFPNLLKFIGALAITTVIFFALSPEDKIEDEVLNRSMEFLGSKLLAMVPEDQKHNVQKEFDDFREQTLDGKVSDEHLKGFAVTVLNAEAEGKKFNQEQVDSLLLSIREAEIAKAEAEIAKEESKVERREELIAISEQVQDFAKFEKEWNKMIPVPPLPDSSLPPPPPRRPLYRLNSNFVVEVDTAAIAEAVMEHAKVFAGKTPGTIVVHPVEVDRAVKDIARELPRLKIEMRQMKLHLQMADSIKRVMVDDPYRYAWQMEWDTEMSDSIKKAMKEMRQEQMQLARLQRLMADSTRRAAEAQRREYLPPPPTPATPKPEKPPH